ncbi:MAG TPA: hypothetical protein VF131_01675 [Blastocatellia bacterium]|nr:hypothetical protein [Blastocatellia bacterium]
MKKDESVLIDHSRLRAWEIIWDQLLSINPNIQSGHSKSNRVDQKEKDRFQHPPQNEDASSKNSFMSYADSVTDKK